MSITEQIRIFTEKKIQRILTTPSDSEARAVLARLRHGVGHTPGEIPDLWGDFLLGMPEELLGHGTEISKSEWAIYTALTLFAFHQQGKSRNTESMHNHGTSIGAAARALIKDENEDRERISRHFYPVAMAADMTELSVRLRSLISLLRTNNIALDYAKLAADLYLFQLSDVSDSIKLRWGEDFCKLSLKDNE